MPTISWFGDDVTWFGDDLSWFGATPDEGGEPPVSTPAGIPDPAAWVWAVGPGASASSPGPHRQLTAAHGRTVTWRTSGHAFAQFSIDGRNGEAAAIVDRESDLWVWRDGVLMFRGRIVSGTDQVDATSHRCQFNAIDYRGMLGLVAKVEPPVPVFTADDQAQIAWSLISDWQALDGADWGITEGVGATTGVPRDETDITPGAPVAEVIDRLANRENGFEWEISPDLKLNRWHPQRGSDNNVVLDHGGTLASVSTQTGEFANVGIATGKDTTTPAVFEHPSLTGDQRGRWPVVGSYPSVTLQDTVDGKAQWLASQGVTIERQWRAVMSPRRWTGRDHVWLGDTVHLVVKSGRLQVPKVPHRVAEVQVVLDANGEETVTFGLNGIEAGAVPGVSAPTSDAAQFAQTLAAMRSDIADLKRTASI